MRSKSDIVKIITLGATLTTILVLTSKINVRTTINNAELDRTAKQAPVNLKDSTLTDEEVKAGIAGSTTTYGKYLANIKKAAALSANKTVAIDLQDGYYSAMTFNTKGIYNEGVSDSMVGDATAANVLTGKTFTNSTTVGETGTMMDIVNTEGKVGYHETSGAKYVIATQAAVEAANVYDTNDANTHAKLGYYIGVKYTGGAGYLANNSWLLTPAENFGDAAVGNVLSGKTFTSTAGVKKTGTMANVAAIDPAKSLSVGSTYTYVRMTNGAHITNASSGYPEVRITNSDLASAAGLTAAKIVKGNTIMGIAGTATSNELLLFTHDWKGDNSTNTPQNVFPQTPVCNSTYFTKDSSAQITVKKACNVKIYTIGYVQPCGQTSGTTTYKMALNGTNFVNKTLTLNASSEVKNVTTTTKSLKVGDKLTGHHTGPGHPGICRLINIIILQ